MLLCAITEELLEISVRATYLRLSPLVEFSSITMLLQPALPTTFFSGWNFSLVFNIHIFKQLRGSFPSKSVISLCSQQRCDGAFTVPMPPVSQRALWASLLCEGVPVPAEGYFIPAQAAVPSVPAQEGSSSQVCSPSPAQLADTLMQLSGHRDDRKT